LIVLDKLQSIEDRFLELESLVSDPAVINRMDEWRKYAKEHARLRETVEAFRAYKKAAEGLKEAKEMLAEGVDGEMARYLKEEIASLTAEKES
jgi:peptide chain release factor 1